MPLKKPRIGERALQRVVLARERGAKRVEVGVEDARCPPGSCARRPASPPTTCSDARRFVPGLGEQ